MILQTAKIGDHDVTFTSKFNRGLLRSGAALTVLAAIGSGIAAPAYAQDTTDQVQEETSAETTATTAEESAGEEIVVTGSLLRNPAGATAIPIVSVTADDLDKRGITTVTDYLQTMSANNAGTVPPSWSAQGFTTGASAPSLRGFNDAYTLVLFDGLRSAVYPLADDTQRNITDINTIPAWSIGSVDTLLGGASATYGSDAIAGVVNVITKRDIQGLHGNFSAGISQRGDAGERRGSLAYGFGDLSSDGYNVYIGAEYQKNDALYARDRGFPFNTANVSSICGTAEQGCLFNGILNGIQGDGSYLGFQRTPAFAVRPYNPATVLPTGATAPLGPWQYTGGCNNGTTAVTLNGDQAIPGTTPADNIVCQQDALAQFQMYNSEIERKGAAFRATKRFGDSEAFFSFNYYNTKTFNESDPGSFTGSTAAGGRRVTVSGFFLPVYVCPQGTMVVGTNPATGNISGPAIASGCTNPDGTPVAGATLNPNNPFAAQGNLAQLSLSPRDPRQTFTDARSYRVAIGANGEFGDGFSYNVGATASRVDLDVTNRGYIFLQGLLDAIATGTYNFVDQDANTQAAMDQVFPEQRSTKVSKLWQVQAAIGKDLVALPGGDLTAAVGGQFRRESLDNPSSNAPNDTNPYARYYGINAVGVQGSRDIWSLNYEVTAPILDMLRVRALGSYDHYSTGQKAFSPSFDMEFSPIDALKIRGSWSRGFRAPNLNESFQLPATGYQNANIVCSEPVYAAFCAAHASNPSYYAGGYSPGLTSLGNPELKPEKSTGYTIGAVFQPNRNMTLTVDFWQTKIKNLIVPPSVTGDIIEQYYTNNGVVNVPGVTVTPGNPDPQNPNALPLLGFIEAPFQNANAFLGRGIDATADVRVPLTGDVSLRSVLSASYLLRLQQMNDDDTVWRYDGTLGPCNWTSCSGAPKFRANWQNTFEFGETANLTLTANYTSSYSMVATDAGGVYGDCQASADNGQLLAWDNGEPVQCRSKSIFWVDGHGEFKPNERVTLYADVLNIFDRKPPVDWNAAYGIYHFNPAWADRLYVGRYFRMGARFDF
ncbi:TonB-dependent receptor domain-containing protein [Allosphingosinicella vermicomposti]|uniref:TonB-dependent receptor domain-containing protein n=1 Tax=Allosphingosinicella vermicomposti TaxID=614671 RepID=UPI001FE0BCF8|nr:TonB-dependent receptor [Allosphingosinicella vermicomposti]